MSLSSITIVLCKKYFLYYTDVLFSSVKFDGTYTQVTNERFVFKKDFFFLKEDFPEINTYITE